MFGFLEPFLYGSLHLSSNQQQMISALLLRADLHGAIVSGKYYGTYGHLETGTQWQDSACCLSLGIPEVSLSYKHGESKMFVALPTLGPH